MKGIIVLCAILSVASAASLKVKRAVSAQSPKAFAALEQLRGKNRLSNKEQYDLINNAREGEDFPALEKLPQTSFDCSSTKQPGFYADPSEVSRCQVFHRCDINGNQTSYLCPALSVFNQITLTCSWFFDVDCSKVVSYYDYSNSRLYQGASVPLLDDDQVRTITGAKVSGSATISASSSSSESSSEE